MPFPVDAIKGQPSPERTRAKVARESEQEFSTLPDWMFWKREEMEAYIKKASVPVVLQEIGNFARIMIRNTGHYEEREK